MTREPHAHRVYATPALPADRWQRDIALVLGAIAFVLLIATVALLLNPAPLG